LKNEIEKKNLNYVKAFKIKKITIKIMRIKIVIENKFYILLKDEIEKKNPFSKRIKKYLKE
jgi:hypothetical protein